jgi:transposase
MSRRKKHPLRPLTPEERGDLETISRSHTQPASRVARAKSLLAVADGETYSSAARQAGRRSREAVSQLVSQFNQTGMSALDIQHRGGAQVVYGAEQRERILREIRRTPDREQDGTATWSLTTIQRSLRQSEDEFSKISRDTIWRVLHEANMSWQKSRSWCTTGQVQRKRKSGIVTVIDPQREAKKTH